MAFPSPRRGYEERRKKGSGWTPKDLLACRGGAVDMSDALTLEELEAETVLELLEG